MELCLSPWRNNRLITVGATPITLATAELPEEPDPDDSDVPVGEGGDTGGDRGGDDGDESLDSPESGELGDSLEFSSTTTGSLSSEEPPDPSELVGEVAPPSTPGERGLRLPARPNLGCWGWPEVPEAPSVGAMTLPLMAVGVNANIVSL